MTHPDDGVFETPGRTEYVVKVDKVGDEDVEFTCIIDDAGELVGDSDLGLPVERFLRVYRPYVLENV